MFKFTQLNEKELGSWWKMEQEKQTFPMKMGDKAVTIAGMDEFVCFTVVPL